jgi:hypothetical protein
MPSDAFDKFNWNIQEVERLEEAYDALSPNGQGRRALGHITKSALVMLCAAWELYCEDVILESIKFINSRLNDPALLPKDVKKKISSSISNDKNELACFKLAGDGWKSVYYSLAKNEIARFNTPKSEPVGLLFKNYLGVENISSEWTIGPDGINDIISCRGEIAHRGRDAPYVTRSDLDIYKNKIVYSATETDNFLTGYLKGLVNANFQPWRRKNLSEITF